MRYGGSDITRMFYWLLTQVSYTFQLRLPEVLLTPFPPSSPFLPLLFLPSISPPPSLPPSFLHPILFLSPLSSTPYLISSYLLLSPLPSTPLHSLPLPPQTKLPYSGCTTDSRLDGVLIQELKESICHLDPSLRGVKEHQFSVLSPTPGVLLDYDMKLSDEALQAPMGMFFPSVFCLPDDHTPLMWGQEPLGPDCEDIYDEGHWIAEGGGAGSQVRGGVAGGVGKTDVQGVSGNGAGANGCGQLGELPEATKRLRSVPAGKLLGVDQAVHLSIDCASEYRGLCCWGVWP